MEITKLNRLGGLLLFFQCAKNTVRYLQDEAAYCLQDTFKLTKAILKCQLDIFDQIGLILAELQEQARQEAEEGGNES